jgi:hypothetical protein
MSREFGWKEFEPDSAPAEETPAESGVGTEPGPLPWASAPPLAGPPADAETIEDAPLAEPVEQTAPAQAGPLAVPAQASKPSAGGFRLGELLWLWLGIVDLFLALDFGLRAIAAGDSSFVRLVENVGNWLAQPFVGIFSNRTVPRVDHTAFWAALVAIVIYTLAAWIIIRLLRVLATPAASSRPRG